MKKLNINNEKVNGASEDKANEPDKPNTPKVTRPVENDGKPAEKDRHELSFFEHEERN